LASGENPKSDTSPELGRNNPKIIFIVVDFPEPFGPKSPNTSPRLTLIDKSETA
jgi:hypothetical protein